MIAGKVLLNFFKLNGLLILEEDRRKLGWQQAISSSGGSAPPGTRLSRRTVVYRNARRAGSKMHYPRRVAVYTVAPDRYTLHLMVSFLKALAY